MPIGKKVDLMRAWIIGILIYLRSWAIMNRLSDIVNIYKWGKKTPIRKRFTCAGIIKYAK